MKPNVQKRQQATKERKAMKRKDKKKQVQGGGELPPNYLQQVDQLTAMAMSVIYNEQTRIEESHIPQALEDAKAAVKNEDDVAPAALADVALWVLSSVEDNLEARKGSVTPLVVMGAIGRIVAEVVELATAAGLVQMTEEDVQISISVAINKYIPEAKKAGKVTDQELQEAAAALQKAYPEEAENFKQMVKARLQRQRGQQPQEQPSEAPQMMNQQPQQGLLNGGA
jgi:hypothetical protein